MKKLLLALVAGALATAPAFAQGSNDFFGSSVPGQGNNTSPPPGAAAAEQQLGNNPADYTSDEKRMQKKHRGNISAAQKLIAKAEKMIKFGEKGKNDKVLKKGKILKEIGEKRLAQLKDSNPVQ